MGLDMYLRASKYVSGYSFRGEQEQEVYTHLVKEFGVDDFVDSETPSATVEFTVGYLAQGESDPHLVRPERAGR